MQTSEKEKTAICLRVSNRTREYFRREADALGIPYQTLMNIVLNKYAEGGFSLGIQKEEKN